MLLRNIDKSLGLRNGTRLIVSNLENHVMEEKVISSTNIGDKVLIPRLVMTPSNTRLPFKLKSRQFS